jgi:hypothetical protein
MLANPFPTITEDYDNDQCQWREITTEAYDHFLELLPPLTMSDRGFIYSEPICHTADDQAVYACFRQQNQRYYARLATCKEYKALLILPISEEVSQR